MKSRISMIVLASTFFAAAAPFAAAGELENLSFSGFGALQSAMAGIKARLADEPVSEKQKLLDSKLLSAVGSLNIAEIRRLVALGANPNAYDGYNFTPLTTAVMDHGDADVMNALFDLGAKADFKGTCDITALHYAAEYGRLEAAKLLVAHHADYDAKACLGETPFYYAVKAGKTDAASYLLGLGADPNATDYERKTALMAAVRVYSSERKDILALLLGDRRTNVNAQDEKGMTALKLVVKDNRVELVKLLLGVRGINVNDDAGGVTALFLAQLDNHQEIVDLLRGAGAVDKRRSSL